MKIIVNVDREDGRIHYVKSFDYYLSKKIENIKAEEDVLRAATDANKHSGYEAFKVIEVEGDLAEVMTFLLGEKKYKAYSDIDGLEDSIDELSCSASQLYDAAFDLNEEADRIRRDLKELKELFKTLKSEGKV